MRRKKKEARTKRYHQHSLEKKRPWTMDTICILDFFKLNNYIIGSNVCDGWFVAVEFYSCFCFCWVFICTDAGFCCSHKQLVLNLTINHILTIASSSFSLSSKVESIFLLFFFFFFIVCFLTIHKDAVFSLCVYCWCVFCEFVYIIWPLLNVWCLLCMFLFIS